MDWYKILLQHVEDLSDLMASEIEQIPANARQTFRKVLAALGCGFYSYNLKLVESAFELFIKLFKEF